MLRHKVVVVLMLIASVGGLFGCSSDKRADWDLLSKYPVDPREWGKPDSKVGRVGVPADVLRGDVPPSKLGNPPRARVERQSLVDRRDFWMARDDRERVACLGEPEETCAYPMVPHCHGWGDMEYCHAHPGGEYPHTHTSDYEFDADGRGVGAVGVKDDIPSSLSP